MLKHWFVQNIMYTPLSISHNSSPYHFCEPHRFYWARQLRPHGGAQAPPPPRCVHSVFVQDYVTPIAIIIKVLLKDLLYHILNGFWLWALIAFLTPTFIWMQRITEILITFTFQNAFHVVKRKDTDQNSTLPEANFFLKFFVKNAIFTNKLFLLQNGQLFVGTFGAGKILAPAIPTWCSGEPVKRRQMVLGQALFTPPHARPWDFQIHICLRLFQAYLLHIISFVFVNFQRRRINWIYI